MKTRLFGQLNYIVIKRIYKYRKAIFYLACILVYIGGGIIMENYLKITEPAIYGLFGGIIGVVLGNIANMK